MYFLPFIFYFLPKLKPIGNSCFSTAGEYSSREFQIHPKVIRKEVAGTGL